MTLKQRLISQDYLASLAMYIERIDLDQIERFVRSKVNHLFENVPKMLIQQCVFDDSVELIVNYLTHIVEVGSVKSIALNAMQSLPTTELDELAHILTSAYNLCLATELSFHNISGIPVLSNGLSIYYSDNALLMISDRVVQHVTLSRSYGNYAVDIYANELISVHLVIQ